MSDYLGGGSNKKIISEHYIQFENFHYIWKYVNSYYTCKHPPDYSSPTAVVQNKN